MNRMLRTWAVCLALIVAMYAPACAAGGTDDGVGDAIDAIQRHAGSRRLLLIGEFHGTRQIPKLVEGLARRYATTAPLRLALEIPRGEQAALDAYMASDGGASARADVMGRPWWSRPDDQHDGRRSMEMLELIEAMRSMHSRGRDVALLAYDVDATAVTADPDARDRAMALRLRQAMSALHRGRLLVLGGNVHAMLEKPAGADPRMPRPAGSWLRDLHPVSVRVGARSGESWACTSRCTARRADNVPARTGPLDGPYTFGVSLDRFTIAHLIGASRAH